MISHERSVYESVVDRSLSKVRYIYKIDGKQKLVQERLKRWLPRQY